MRRREVLLTGFAVFGLEVAWVESLSRAGSIVWLRDEERAFAESRWTGRPVLVEAWAEWCTACKLMDRNTWSDPDVQREVRSRFIPLRIDLTEESPASNARREVYGVDGLPTVLSCRAAGCADSTATRATGYLRPAEMLAFLAARG